MSKYSNNGHNEFFINLILNFFILKNGVTKTSFFNWLEFIVHNSDIKL